MQRKWNNSCKVIHKHEGKNKTKTEKTFISQIYLSKYPIVFQIYALSNFDCSIYFNIKFYLYDQENQSVLACTLFNIRQENKYRLYMSLNSSKPKRL